MRKSWRLPVMVMSSSRFTRSLTGFCSFERSQRSALAEDAGVAFFAAKATTHAAADHLHIVGVQVQGVCGFALVAVGVLGRHIQRELAVFFGHGIGDLAFQIELLLLAGAGRALDLVGRVGNGRQQRRHG